QLIEELSIRKTKRARRLLAVTAARLSDIEPEAAEPDEQNDSVNEIAPGEDNWGAPEYDDPGVASRADTTITTHLPSRPADKTAENDQPPDDRRRPARLSRVRPLGTPGLPAPWVRPLNADR